MQQLFSARSQPQQQLQQQQQRQQIRHRRHCFLFYYELLSTKLTANKQSTLKAGIDINSLVYLVRINFNDGQLKKEFI